MSEFDQQIKTDLDTLIYEITGGKEFPFSTTIPDFHEFFSIVQISLFSIHDDIEHLVNTIQDYILSKYIHPRSIKRIRIAQPKQLTDEEQDIQILQQPIHPRIQELLNIPQPEQKSQEWLNQRQSYITASVFGDACGLKGPAALANLILNKVSYGKYRPFYGNKATQWGEKYEDVCNAIYCYRNRVRVFEFGMIEHPDIPFLGASTDGISDELINIEIKSPFSRFITGIPPIGYWAQTQLQMAVLNLEKTHFLECSFYEYDDEEAFFIDFEWLEDDGTKTPVKGDQISFRNSPPAGHHQEKGLMFEVVDLHQENLEGHPKTIYIYSPIRLYKDKAGLLQWREETLQKIITSDHLIFIRVIPWTLTRISCVLIERDRDWFNDQEPILREFWKDVEFYRKQNLSSGQIENLKPKLVAKYVNFGSTTTVNQSESDEERSLHICLLGDSDEEVPEKKKKKTQVKTKSFNQCMLGDAKKAKVCLL